TEAGRKAPVPVHDRAVLPAADDLYLLDPDTDHRARAGGRRAAGGLVAAGGGDLGGVLRDGECPGDKLVRGSGVYRLALGGVVSLPGGAAASLLRCGEGA